jgi:hypothetical protein
MNQYSGEVSQYRQTIIFEGCKYGSSSGTAHLVLFLPAGAYNALQRRHEALTDAIF